MQAENVYGGVGLNREGNPSPSAMGRLCRWSSPRPAMTYASYEDFHNSLQLRCEDIPKNMAGVLSKSSVFTFIPDDSMPDTIYYQSFMAKHLGGKIHLKSKCHSRRLPSSASVKALPTFRPDMMKHLSGLSTAAKSPRSRVGVNRFRSSPGSRVKEVLSQSETQRRVRLPNASRTKTGSNDNRRIAFDDTDAYDYDDYNGFGTGSGVGGFYSQDDLDLYQRCKDRAASKRSLDVDMPTFEHFPIRDIMRTESSSRLDSFPTSDECKQFSQSSKTRRKLASSTRSKSKKKAESEVDSGMPSLFSYLPGGSTKRYM